MAHGTRPAQAATRSLDLLGASLVRRQLFANSIIHRRAVSRHGNTLGNSGDPLILSIFVSVLGFSNETGV